MNIIVNGQATTTEFLTLAELIDAMNLQGQRFAVEMNEQIISKAKFSTTSLTENAKIEIIQAVGGG